MGALSQLVSDVDIERCDRRDTRLPETFRNVIRRFAETDESDS
jgi:hypothetical protein